MIKEQLIKKAKEEGRRGQPYYWSDADRRMVQSVDYTMPDGRIIGVPLAGAYGVEVRHPDGRVEYVHQ